MTDVEPVDVSNGLIFDSVAMDDGRSARISNFQCHPFLNIMRQIDDHSEPFLPAPGRC
jgi:hypothetical protein